MSLLTASPEKHRGKTKSFWAGSPVGSIAVQVAAKRSQDELQYRLGRERILARYAELKAR